MLGMKRVGLRMGNYTLTTFLGAGGFAEVYVGVHLHLQNLAAVKILARKLTKDEFENFKEEALKIARLSHPSIVKLLEFGVDGESGTPFLVINYAPNGSLRQRHAAGSVLPLPLVLTYVKQLASALQYAHASGIVHRDVKPDNMLVGEQNQILLSDFGIAVTTQQLDARSTPGVMGSAPYMAPEQWRGQPQPGSDQYALGIVIYEWLCGTPPFQGTAIQLAAQHVATPPQPLRKKLPWLSSEVEEVVMKALAKDPLDRFASMQAFAHAFELACQVPMTQEAPSPVLEAPAVSPTRAESSPIAFMDTVSTPPLLPPAQKSPRASRRNVLLGGLAATAVVAGGTVGALAWTHHLPPLPAIAGLTGSNTPTSVPRTVSTHVLSAVTPTSAPAVSLLSQARLVYRHHAGTVYTVAWSPNGRSIATGSADKTVQVWDAKTGNQVSRYTGHTGSIWTLSWSPDSQHVVSGSNDKTVHIWDVRTGRLLLPVITRHLKWVQTVSWSPDGKYIASGGNDTTVLVWDAANATLLYSYEVGVRTDGHTSVVTDVTWSPDSQLIASASDDHTVQVWSALTGSASQTYRGYNQDAFHLFGVFAVAWSPDGKHIASAGQDHRVQVWDATALQILVTFSGHTDDIFGLAWSPDSQRVVSVSIDHTARVWNVKTQSPVPDLIYQGHSDAINSVAWSPDGASIVSCGFDGTAQVWPAPR